MRTTLSLDSDVARRLQQELAFGKASFKQIVNESLRQGLGLSKPRGRYRVEPHSSAYQPGVDRGKLNQVVDELAADSFKARCQ